MIGFLISAIKIIFLLGFLILIHESGHFLVAKLCKVKVNEFAIGFGPTIWKKQGLETRYALRLIPLGGFVSMEGEEEASDAEGSFSKASIPKRITIVVAGATVNILFGLIVYFIFMASTGVTISNEINAVLDGYNSVNSGLEANDKVIEIDGITVKTRNDVTKILSHNNGEELKLKIDRNGDIIDIYLKPTMKEINGVNAYYIGVTFKPVENTFANHIYYGFVETGKFSVSIVDNLKSLIFGGVKADQMMGIVGISDIVVSTNGFKEFIYILALVSVSLGVTNLLPIPALDGGKLVILIIEAIRKKPLKQEIEASITFVGFSILIALSIYVTYNDILRIFR